MHEEFIEAAIELINENGRETVFKSPNSLDDADKPWQGSSSELVVIATQKSVYVPLSSKSELGLKFIPQSLLQRVNEVLLVANEGTDLSGARLITDGVEFRVEWCYALKPGETTILYAFGISK